MNNPKGKIITLIIIAGILQKVFPWGIIFFPAFMVGFIGGGSKSNGFWSGFIGIALLWGSYAFYINTHTDAVLSEKTASILYMPNAYALILLTACIGGIVGGLSCLSGVMTYRRLFKISSRKESESNNP